jgi:hypothetical protein
MPIAVMTRTHDRAGWAQTRAPRAARMVSIRRIYVPAGRARPSLGTQEVVVFLPAAIASFLAYHSFLEPGTCQSRLPSNLDAGQLAPNAIELLQRSLTFRRQCMRVAVTPRVRIRIVLGTRLEPGARAEASLERYDAGAIHAVITIRFAETYPELLGHELEHVAEALDGVRMTEEYAAGRAWQTPTGAFETRRARSAGERVQAEFEASAPEAVKADPRHTPAGRHAVQ